MIHNERFARHILPNLPAVPMALYANCTGVRETQFGEITKKGGEWNTFVEVTWVLEGELEVLLGEETVRVEAGYAIYHLPGEPRWMRCVAKKNSYRYLCFDGPLAEAVMTAYRYPRLQRTSTYPAEVFARLEAVIGSENPQQIRLAAGLILEILASLAVSEEREKSPRQLVSSCSKFIRDHLEDPELGLPMLCDQFSTSRSTLNRLFHQYMLVAPGRYILDLRLAHASSLLTGSDVTIREVARQSGFHDAKAFTRFIRRSTGLSPVAYRQKFRKQRQADAAFSATESADPA